MMTQHCINHTALFPQPRQFSMHVIAEVYAVPREALHELALSDLAARCSVE